MQATDQPTLKNTTALAVAAQPQAASSAKMDHSLIRSIAWNAAGDWTSQIFAWAAFLAVTRLLKPADFGMIAMACTIGPFVQFFSGIGIPRAIVTLKNLSDEQLAQLNTLGLMQGFGSFGLAMCLAKPIALFYRDPRIALVIMVSCSPLILNGVQTVSNGLLLKAMRFRILSLYTAVSAVMNAAFTLLFAWLGWGYWALVLGSLPGALLRTALVMRTRRQTYAIPHWTSVAPVVKFGAYVVLSLVALSIYQSLDDVIAGRTLGAIQLGFYGLAWTLAHVPLDKVTSLVTMVVPSYFSALQEDLSGVRRTLGNLTEGCALLMFPACVGLGLVAHDFVRVVLGAKWAGVAGPLQILAIYTSFRSIVALLPRMLIALGQARFVMWNDFATIVVLGTAFYFGSHWGTTGIAWGWVAAYPFVAMNLYHRVFSRIRMSAIEYLQRLRPAIEGTLAMTLAVIWISHAMQANRIPALRLGLDIIAGGFVYAATLWLRHRNRVMAFVRTARNACLA